MSNHIHSSLGKLQAVTSGSPDVIVGVIDGPVRLDHEDLSANISSARNNPSGSALARRHGTFIAGILSARTDAPVPGICPGCTVIVRPLSALSALENGIVSLSPDELAAAIVECIQRGAQIINLSLSLSPSIGDRTSSMADALRLAASRGVLVIAASGNGAHLHDSELTAHPWVIPVVSLAADGRYSIFSTTSPSIGSRGVGAPGENIHGLSEQGGHVTLSGTSAAAAFVTGAAALLRASFTKVSPEVLRAALVGTRRLRRTLYPPPLNAWAAYLQLSQMSL
ncbi:Subtilase family protein [Duganella sp. CF517]|uniref:S8 family peptidase n=1 Tax=Duganella sp. CF517 TaxID=1881038 RepID=UPI0008D48FF5|nr:S8 family serine peptidase [Duganella sp. CF517]SEN82537.1 Subtilase family protein [Duganella sp. CF517]